MIKNDLGRISNDQGCRNSEDFSVNNKRKVNTRAFRGKEEK